MLDSSHCDVVWGLLLPNLNSRDIFRMNLHFHRTLTFINNGYEYDVNVDNVFLFGAHGHLGYTKYGTIHLG